MARTDTPSARRPVRAGHELAVEMAMAGHSHGEIARALGITRNVVGGILRRQGVRSGRLRTRSGQPSPAGCAKPQSARATKP